ncbi:MAG: abortive infection family protein [Humidesulfovibrio sp.]
MLDLDALAPNYRRAQQRWPDAPTLVRCHDSLKACFNGNANGLIEHVKSFVESVCLTIMGEFREPMPSAQPSMTALLVAALNPLGLKNTRGASKLDKVLSGFNKLTDAINEMRNDTGAVAHGKDGFLDAIEVDHARAFLHAGDAILSILLNAFEGKQPDLIVTREPYESFPHLNERIDRAVTVTARIDEDEERPIVVFSVATGPSNEAIELRIEPSRLLYGVDREAYVEALKTAGFAVAEEPDEEEPKAESEIRHASVASSPAVSPRKGPVTELVTEYKGSLTALRDGVETFLQAEDVDPAVAGADGLRLIDSLLATAEQNFAIDWKQRETVQAKLKVACKRVLIRFACPPDKADAVADRFVSWLRVQASDTALPAPVVPDQGAQA